MCNALLRRVMKYQYISACWRTRDPQNNSQGEKIFRRRRIFWWYLGQNDGEYKRNVSKNIDYKLSHKIYNWGMINLEKTGNKWWILVFVKKWGRLKLNSNLKICYKEILSMKNN